MTALVVALFLSVVAFGFGVTAWLIEAPERPRRRSGAHARARAW